MSMQPPRYQRFFADLKRRKVFRVMAVYGAVSFGVLQGADVLVPVLGLPDSVTRGIFLFLLVGFPVAVVLAWAFDVTPEGVRRTTEASPDELNAIIEAPAVKRWVSGLLALAGMVALLAGAWYAGRESAPGSETGEGAAPPSASIAVLPFVNMSADPEQEYFSDGISEELLNLLAQISELRVASRTSAFAFKGKGLEIPDIARRLHVAHVLEGSVRKSGNQVRITAQLVDANSDTNLWSETWDRTLDDIFAVQEDIAARVADQLKVTLLGKHPRVKETDPQAYALFLQARQLGHQGTPDGYERSSELLHQALAIDSAYAPAWAELSQDLIYQVGLGMRPVDEGVPLARNAAERALAIDPDYAPAHARLGRIASTWDGDMAAAAEHLKRALELAPTDTEILREAATLAESLGRLDEAIAMLRYAVVRDPVNPALHNAMGNAYQWAGRWDDAIASFRTALSLSPGREITHYTIGLALLGKGEPEAALAAMEKEPAQVWRLLGMALAHHALGQEAEADEALAELTETYAEGWAYNIAYTMAYCGQVDRAFEWLDRAVRTQDAGLSETPVEYLFANLRDDPRWLPFLESIGKAPDQLAAIDFEVELPPE